MKPKHQRLLFILLAALCIGTAVTLVMRNLEDYIVYFHSPSDIAAKVPSPDEYIRVGGMVKEGSITANGNHTRFTITDYAHDITITHTGTLPSLFREKQGIVAEGHYRDGQFTATTILAKHDEYYMPPEVSKTLKDSDEWKERVQQSIEAP